MAITSTSIIYSQGRFSIKASIGNSAVRQLTPAGAMTDQALANLDYWIQIAPSASVNLNSIVAPTLKNQQLLITNTAARTSGFRITIKNEGAGTAVNKMYTPNGGDFDVSPGESVLLVYDTNAAGDMPGARWRVIDMRNPTAMTLSVAVPAVIAGSVGYVDVSTAGTFLAGIVQNSPIGCNPTGDVVAAGIGGGYINARVSGTSTVRLAFVGATSAGNQNFVFWRP